MTKATRLTAHSLIRPALEGLLERTRSAADRVIRDRQDEEAVHDFRVALRRLRTILQTSRAVYGKKRVKRLEALAKAFGDATSALRDAEVLEDTLRAAILDNRAQEAAAVWLREAKRQEGEMREQAVALVAGEELGELSNLIRRLLAGGPKRDPLVTDYADAGYEAVRQGVLELLPIGADDIEGLHRLRIRFKRLRYTSEMLTQFMTVIDATGRSKRERETAHKLAARYAAVARDASRMQKELGLLHDADQALAAVGTAPLEEPERVAIVTALSDLRRRLALRSLERLDKLPPRIVGETPVAGGEPTAPSRE